MKKNIMLRLSAVLLVAVLLTTCVISGTWAKYVTSGNAEDSARVAKWGVTVTVAGDETAVLDTNGGAAEAQIVSNDGELLAPGTKGTLGQVTITGTPEVAVTVEYSATVTLTGWTVTSGYYCPLVVKVNGTAVDTTSVTDADDYEAAIKAAIEDYSEYIAAGKDLSTVANEIVITWEWAYEGDNAKDTELGNLGTAPSISITLTCTVTQAE